MAILPNIKRRGDKVDFLRKIFQGKEKERKNSLFIIFLIGVLLITFLPMLLQKKSDVEVVPTETNNNSYSSNSYERELEKRLESILSNVAGAGEVSVMVTVNKSSELIVSENFEQSNNLINETDANNGVRTTEQVTTKKSTQVLGQNEEPLVLTELSPTVSGVIIVCEGANDIIVKDALIRSVSTLLGIPTYKVEVLPKK